MKFSISSANHEQIEQLNHNHDFVNNFKEVGGGEVKFSISS